MAALLVVVGCSKPAGVQGARNPNAGAPIAEDIGVAVVEGSLGPTLADELARELSKGLTERGLRSAFRLIPPDETLAQKAFSELFHAHKAVLIIAPTPSRAPGPTRFTIEVLKIIDEPSPENPEAISMLEVWKGELESPTAKTKEEVLPLLAREVVNQLVSDQIVI